MPRARELLGPGGPLSRALAGYEDREGQLQMADAVERALREGTSLLCEAGTGTGKTLAYLVPAILSGKKVVVSTATKALEEQIFTNDLPMLFENLRLAPRAAMVKGLGNYLCLRRFDELRKSTLAHASPRSLPLVEAWAEDTETGDLAELATLAENDPIRHDVASSSDTRIGSSCKFYDECFVTRMKRDAEEARLVVVNHHLFFADLAVKMAASRRGFAGAGALPPYDAVIFDEAHEIEDIATDFFGVRVSRAKIARMIADADRAFVAARLADAALGKGEGTALGAIVIEAAERFFRELVRASLGAGLRGDEAGRASLPREVWRGEVLAAYHALDASLEALEGWAGAHAVDEAVKLVSERASSVRDELGRIVDPATNQVVWIDLRERSEAIGAAPIDIGPIFRDRVIEHVGAVVLTSATLTAGGSFRYVRQRLGLAEQTQVPVEELTVPSPFDYPSAALLYTPRDLPEANDPSFVKIAAERVLELVKITGGGAFVLCTSIQRMRAFAAALRGRTPLPALVQGDAPKGRLLARFRSEKNGVLVATMSFWEGVDVPGDALRLVVIDKIPFAVPADPIVAARSRALEAHGENPFVAYSVPDAAITLKQGFGRLIRTQNDRGIVAILDRRIRTKGYGTTLLASLPPARRTDRIEDVTAFYARAYER